MHISNQTNKNSKYFIIGVILFTLTIIFFQIFIIRQEVNSLKGCSPGEYKKMLIDPLRYWIRVFFQGSLLGACAGIIVLMIYGLNLFILNIYKKIKNTFLKALYCLILPIIYIIICRYRGFAILNNDYKGWQNLGSIFILLFIFYVLMLSYIGLVIHIVVKKIKNSRKQ